MDVYEKACKAIVKQAVKQHCKTLAELNRIKMLVLNDFAQVTEIPNNADLLVSASAKEREILGSLLSMKPMRTISGVSPIALMTDPYPCPHSVKGIGPCTYCPGGPGSPWGDVPQSYTGEEPSTRRSIRNEYDPYLGVFNRLEHYIAMNHSPQKVEIILQGGTFPFMPPVYQEYFVKFLFKAMNDFSRVFYHNGQLLMSRFKQFFELPALHKDGERIGRIHKRTRLLKYLNLDDQKTVDAAIDLVLSPHFFDEHKLKKEFPKTSKKVWESYAKSEGQELPKKDNQNHNVRVMSFVLSKTKIVDDSAIQLEQEQVHNESAHIRCVGLTIETKSDYGKALHGNGMLKLGCTRVELGIQSIYDEVLKKTNRGNTVADNVESIRDLKDLGFKINAHMMPGLPGVTPKMDRDSLKALFDDPDYQPDMLKIYPCMVLEGTTLHNDFKKGLFTPMTTPKAAKMIAWFMQYVPEFCRVMRVQRDIPTFMTEGGVDKTNLRQYIDAEMKKQGIVPRDIRAREPGHTINKQSKSPKLSLRTIEYDASHGKEFFIQIEDAQTDIMYGYCKLRFPSQSLREEITDSTAIVRELHVFGKAVSWGQKGDIQHKGLGKQLLTEAERIAKSQDKHKVVVISGVGVRNYYRKFGYERDGPYMSKKLK